MLRGYVREEESGMKEVTKQAEETQISHKTLRLMIGTLCSVIGTLLAIYVGGWLMLCKTNTGSGFCILCRKSYNWNHRTGGIQVSAVCNSGGSHLVWWIYC